MKDKLEKIINGQKILILGLGREGLSTYSFLRKYLPEKDLIFADQKDLKYLDPQFSEIKSNDKKTAFITGDNYLDALTQCDAVIKTPGIPNKTLEIEEARKKGIIFLSQTSIFLELFRSKVIGITGTKGKSTTTSLIHHLLVENGVKAELIGNIGSPVLNYAENAGNTDWFVFEMSSHQLSDIKISPHISVFLNIFPEHLDYYKDFTDYFSAKKNIARYQNADDIFISNLDSDLISDISRNNKASNLYISTEQPVKNGCFYENNKIKYLINGNEKFEFRADDLPLLGKHNINNLMAAFLAAVSTGLEPSACEKALKTFRPLEGRLENVGIVNEVAYINDTLATIPEAAVAAIDTFKEKKLTVILGGFDRGLDFNEFGYELSRRTNIANVILIGTVSERLQRCLEAAGFKSPIYNLGFAKMPKVVKLASDITVPGGYVLLSPAATSFDMFKDYRDRGEQFRLCVNNLKK